MLPEEVTPTEEAQAEAVEPEQAPAQEVDVQDEQNEVSEVEEQTHEPVEEVEEEEDFPFQPPQETGVAPFTPEDLQMDEAGNIDVNALLATFNDKINAAQQGAVNQSLGQVEARDKYKEEWSKAESKYPELKENKELREWVYARHADAIERTGKWMSPTKAADSFFKLTRAAENKGIETAQTNVSVQKSAALETSNNTGRSGSSVASDLQAKLSSTNPQEAAEARRAILSQRIKEGRI